MAKHCFLFLFLQNHVMGPSRVQLPRATVEIVRIMSGSAGEHFRRERDADGKTVNVFTGGMKDLSIED